jgi:hypothetical protein
MTFIKELAMKSLVITGPLLPGIVTFAILRKRLPAGRCLFIASVLSLMLFSICVAVPYYFQGYRQISEPQPGKPLGLTAMPFLGDFAYVYTFEAFGFSWLFVGLLQAVFGEATQNKYLNTAAKTAVTLLFGLLLFQFHHFSSTINIVLE